ncbi:hypothetical protein I6A84_17740 [Frankia sp. CNm7]|uniref:Uncharacterized protein n=1 Tax=Frankia nepalensis TaxID=1836974 RepID=A0A937UR34_9ACTN|nr:hypothetical protein [Frankia nepalensis]MBL7497543.1 hypothetical protein [Frankia nepalensis]MBL7515453.1 hypothetical protein [Frankia nepalensis]MBL7519886.1 hypothetical protein [Frankia nepalensis]MBL7630902.1 hypothetical protein [Frankia nepalensis]
MGTSLRGRLSRVTEMAPDDGRNRRGDRGQDVPTGMIRGGIMRRSRTAGLVEQRSGRGHLRHGAEEGADAGGTMSRLLGQSGPRDIHVPVAAREAAGRAGSAFTSAAGVAARAGQSAASATRDAGSALAHRMSDASGRVSDASGRVSERAEHLADYAETEGRWSPGRWSGREREEQGRQRRSWEEPREAGWEQPGEALRRAGEMSNGHGGRWGRHGRRSEESHAAGTPAAERAGRAGWRERPWESGEQGDPRSWERGGGRSLAEPGGRMGRRERRMARESGQDRAPGRHGEWAGRPEGSQEWSWERSALPWEEMGEHAMRGLSKRTVRRVEKARGAADESASLAYEAAERAMRHSHSRRARRSERKAVEQADKAQRMLDTQLERLERRLAQSRRRRRRGVGLLLLAGAGAGIAVAARRYLGQPRGGEPGLTREEQAMRAGMAPAGAGFPGTDRLSEGMASDVTAGRMEEMPGVDTMSDSTSRRF